MADTRTATIARNDYGVVVVQVNAGAQQSLDDARDNLGAAIEAAGGRRRPVLVDIHAAQPLEPRVRHFYSGKAMADAFTAMALVVEASPLGRMIGNTYLRMTKPSIPARLFEDREAALAWLGRFVEP